MSLTSFQTAVMRMLGELRDTSGDCYVAGGAALNHLIGGNRISRDVDLFNDSAHAFRVSREADIATLREKGFSVEIRRCDSYFSIISPHASISRVKSSTCCISPQPRRRMYLNCRANGIG